MQYRELQAALKNLRQAGYDVQVKLTSSEEILQAEYDRLTSQPVAEPALEMTAEQFNTWVGLPTDNLAIATQDSPAQLQEVQLMVAGVCHEQVKTDIGKQPKNSHSNSQKVHPVGGIAIQAEPRGNTTNQRQNEGSTERQNSKVLIEQRFEAIQVNVRSNPRAYPVKLPSNNPEVLPHKEINIQPIFSYWVDRSELSQHLEATQVQALRNAQDGIRWLKKWARNLQAFAEGFAEGGQVKQSQRSPQVIALDRYRYPQVA